MNKLSFATISQLQSMLVNKEISHHELLDFFLRRFEAFDHQIDSALEVFDKESVLKEFKAQGPLEGIPGILKDNICAKGRIASCASKILENFISPYDATASARLKAAGALLIGRANMDEFAMGSSTETSAFKKTRNPWDTTRVPGGSSGGSAAAVAAGFVPWALGSDTGGSVRQPAAFCGIVGLKPTYGLVSRYGLIAYGSSLDQIGVLTRTVRDNALVFSAIAGHDIKDSSSLMVEKKDYTQKLTGSLPDNVRIGIVENAINAEGMDPEIVQAIDQAVKVLERLGAKVKKISLPTFDYSAAVYFILSRAEAASNLARFDGVRYGFRDKSATTVSTMYSNTRHDGFGTEVKSRILVGNYVLSVGHAGEFYENAKKVRRLMRRELVETFKEVDVLIMPTHPMPAFKFGAFDLNKLQMDLQDYFTCPMNITGIPAISLPCGFTKNKLPIGFQLLGPHLSEDLLYQVAHAYEQETSWHTQHPEGF
ncbi:MAG: Asp-tRNA(Asn)/Glu-tRNA(Gln) amidotransferase subunit GatA [bacterium]|nr:Asp-tRNA(Asn)/Glu-tRNA(Gln) amidotransferase subunit GatA [bacterium]